MKNNIYFVRDNVSKTFKHCFPEVNDQSAVRTICMMLQKDPFYSNYELWRSGVAFDIETGDISTVEKGVISLPASPSAAPKMPVSEGSTKVEVEKEGPK